MPRQVLLHRSMRRPHLAVSEFRTVRPSPRLVPSVHAPNGVCAAARQAVLAQIARKAFQHQDATALLSHAVDLVRQAVGADACGAWEFIENGSSLRLKAAANWPDAAARLCLSFPEPVRQELEQSGRDLHSAIDLSATFDHQVDFSTTLAAVIGPLADAGAFGLLTIHAKREGEFDDDDALFLSAVADILAPLLQWRQADTERELLQTMTVGVSLADNVDSAFAAAMSSVLLVTGWECAECWIPNSDGALQPGPVRALSKQHSAALRQANAEIAFAAPDDLPARVCATRHPEWVADLDDENAFARRSLAHSLNLRTAFAVPVISRDAVLAVFVFYGSERRREDQRLVELIESAMAPVGSFLERKRLEEARRQLEAIVTASDDAIIGKSSDGIITSWNPAAERIYGYLAEEIIGRHVSLLVPPERQDELQQILSRTQQGQHLNHVETLRRTKAGNIIEVALSSAPIRDEHGRVTGTSTIVRDVTERNRIEAQLRQKEKELADFVENATEGIHWAGPEGEILWANRAEMKLLGYTSGEFIGKPLQDFHADPRAATDMMQRLRQGEALHNYEARLRCKNGSVRDVLIDADVLWRNGRFIHTRCFTRDVTERKAAEAALRESEERFRTLADSAPVMMWMTGPDGSFTFFNKTWLEFRGRAAEDETGEGWMKGLHPEDALRFRSTFQAVYEGRNALEVEYRLQRYDQEYRWIFNTGVPRFVRPGELAGYIGSCVDITERKEAEQFLEMHARRQARLIREEVKGRRRAEQRAKDQLTQLAHLSRFSTMGEMATGLAHELNQPLCAIVNFTEACLELLASSAPADEVRSMMAEVAGQAERAGEVIRHMRDFVRKREPRRMAVSAHEIIHDVIALIKPQAVRDRVQIQLELSEPVPYVWADAIQVQQVLVNLVKNGMEAMNDSTGPKQLLVYTRPREKSRLEIAVKDFGVGIPYDDLDEVFAPFRSTKESGMGMGLSISRSIVEAHDGQIWATRNPDRGVTFHFTLPVARSADYGSPQRDSVRSGR